MEILNETLVFHSNLLLVALILVVGILIIYYRRSCKKSLEKIKYYINYIKININSLNKISSPYFILNKYEEKVLKNNIIEIINNSNLENRDKLINLCEQLGFGDRYLKLINSNFDWVKFDAVKCLGNMRIKRSIPDLQKLLTDETKVAHINILSTAIIKAKRNNRDIIEMLEIVNRKKCSKDFLVDIIRAEVEINKRELFLDIYNEFNIDILKIGLKILDEKELKEVKFYLIKKQWLQRNFKVDLRDKNVQHI